jgi:hypothetical protein
MSFTTGNSLFVECLKHSAKPGKHSAKALPSVTLDKESSVKCTSATTSLPSNFYRALGKDFVECHTVLGKVKSSSRRLVTETEPLPSVLSDTRQRVSLFAECPPDYLSAKRSPAGPFVSTFAECTRRHSTKGASLLSPEATSLGKETLPALRPQHSAKVASLPRFR